MKSRKKPGKTDTQGKADAFPFFAGYPGRIFRQM